MSAEQPDPGSIDQDSSPEVPAMGRLDDIHTMNEMGGWMAAQKTIDGMELTEYRDQLNNLEEMSESPVTDKIRALLAADYEQRPDEDGMIARPDFLRLSPVQHVRPALVRAEQIDGTHGKLRGWLLGQNGETVTGAKAATADVVEAIAAIDAVQNVEQMSALVRQLDGYPDTWDTVSSVVSQRARELKISMPVPNHTLGPREAAMMATAATGVYHSPGVSGPNTLHIPTENGGDKADN